MQARELATRTPWGPRHIYRHILGLHSTCETQTIDESWVKVRQCRGPNNDLVMQLDVSVCPLFKFTLTRHTVTSNPLDQIIRRRWVQSTAQEELLGRWHLIEPPRTPLEIAEKIYLLVPFHRHNAPNDILSIREQPKLTI